jgi:hypothetical protein
MAHEWNAGVLTQSSWHGLESVEALPDAETMIRRGEETGAWPTAVSLEKMVTASGLKVPGSAVVAEYLSGDRIAHSAVGNKYRPLDVKEWRETVRAAVKAGAKPAGAFSLRGGSRVLATFEIPGGNHGSGLANHLNIVDALDGSLMHIAGGSTIRVVCANTLAVAMGGRKSKDAAANGFATIRHTASINDRVAALREAIEVHIQTGEKVRDTYSKAREARLAKPDAEAIFAKLFPLATEEERKQSPRMATKLENAHNAAIKAMMRSENFEGPTLASIWNAATWMVDRDEDGKSRPCRGDADKLDSLLFGTRADRIAEVQSIIEVVLADGTFAKMTAPEAATHGVDSKQIGKSLLAAR